MNQREVSELRRRFRPERNAVSRVYGCYVNTNREIVSYIDASLGMLPPEEAEMYLNLLKKAIGGRLGKNLIDIVFTTQQVQDSDEHRLLSDLRDSALQNADAREVFYRQVIDHLDMGTDGYLILLAADSYDVPFRSRDGERQDDASDRVFSYIVCAVCPVKDSALALRYFVDRNEFHSGSAGQVVANPALGFLFPAFDDRAANLYNALYYIQKPGELHRDFLEAVFRTEVPMSAEEQREAFHNTMVQALGEECGFEVLQTVHEQLRERMEEHKEAHIAEPLEVTQGEVRDILRSGGVSEERLTAFDYACAENFGENVVLNPANVIDSGRFEIVTPEVKITVDPSCSYVVETRILDGRKYLLIPAGHDVTVNGIPLSAYTVPEGASDAAAQSVEAAPIPAAVPNADGGTSEDGAPEPDTAPEAGGVSAAVGGTDADDAPPWD